MRMILPLASILTAVSAAGPALAAGDAVRLECHGGAAVEPLCAALRNELQRRGHPLGAQAPVLLTLEARSPDPRVLIARMNIEKDGQLHLGQEGTLSVVDRQALPDGQLQGFAAALLDGAGAEFR